MTPNLQILAPTNFFLRVSGFKLPCCTAQVTKFLQIFHFQNQTELKKCLYLACIILAFGIKVITECCKMNGKSCWLFSHDEQSLPESLKINESIIRVWQDES